MADTIEQQIIDAIVSRLTTIQVSGGFNTDIGTYVEDSRPNWGDPETPDEAISVFEGTVTSEEEDDNGVLVTRTMPVMIKTFHRRRDTAAADAAFARQVLSDVHNAIRSDLTWGVNEVHRTSEKTHGIEYVEGTYEITGTQTEIQIEYEAYNFNLEQ